jgi:hypothetical protein
MSRSSSRPRTLPPQGGNAGSNPARDAQAHGNWIAARATNAGSGGSSPLVGTDARSIRAVSSCLRSLRWTETDRRRAATSSHAGASPARSSIHVVRRHVPLSERLGPGLPNRRAGFDSLAVLETACVGPVMPHGVARSRASLPGWRSWKRRRLLIVLPQVRILPLVPRRRQVERTQPSEGRVCWFESSRRHIWSGTHLGSEAAVYRPRRVRFSSGPLETPGYPNQQRTPAQTRCVAGASPVPGTDGRVAQR